MYFVYVETKGPTLEEIAFIFDGDDAIARVDVDQLGKEVELQLHHKELGTSKASRV